MRDKKIRVTIEQDGEKIDVLKNDMVFIAAFTKEEVGIAQSVAVCGSGSIEDLSAAVEDAINSAGKQFNGFRSKIVDLMLRRDLRELFKSKE